LGTELTKSSDFDLGIDFSDMMMIIMMIVMVSVLSSVATSSAQTAQVMQAMTHEGKRYEKHLVATDKLSYLDFLSNTPYKPLMFVEVENDGPGGVWWAVNNPDDRYWIKSGGSDGAERYSTQERIIAVFFKCNPGETASLHVYGEY